MRIVLIGAGNLATNLGKALSHAEHEIVQIYSRTMVSARGLAHEVGGTPITDLKSLCNDADVYVIALKDSVVGDLLPQICKGREERLFVHTSGSLSMDIFSGHAYNYGVLYPLQTFSKQREVNFQDIPCLLEGVNKQVVGVLKTLASSISDQIYMLSSEKRKYLHLAAVFACNFTNHCYALAEKVLKKQELPFSLLLPLVDETARKVHSESPQHLQTGPAVRNDTNIIQAHLSLLGEDKALQDLYECMSKSIFDMENEKTNQ